jgi:hypothetical protein
MTSPQKNFIAIKLTQNSKNPLPHVSWSAKENQHKSDDLRGGANYGVLCGPVNRITVVDVDDYKAPKNPKLLQGMMGILGTPAYKTYTVSTPSGGKHYYFQHVPEFGTTHNAPDIIPLDIQCKGAYVVGAGSSINGRFRFFYHASYYRPVDQTLCWILILIYILFYFFYVYTGNICVQCPLTVIPPVLGD